MKDFLAMIAILVICALILCALYLSERYQRDYAQNTATLADFNAARARRDARALLDMELYNQLIEGIWIAMPWEALALQRDKERAAYEAMFGLGEDLDRDAQPARCGGDHA
jgi:hypothetical protein